MSPLRRLGQQAAWTSLLALLVAAGCSRPASVPGAVGGARNNPPELPFNGEPTPATGSDQYLPALQKATSTAGSGVPFHDPHSLPPGTLIMVRLDKAISTDDLNPNNSFQATVEEPVIVEGIILVPKGATVVGRVESARASATKRDHGYVRLTLVSLEVGGQDFHVQTASLFARPDPGNAKVRNASLGGAIRLDQGRSLTFRLTGPVEMATSHPAPSQALAKPNF
jgi:hypothetical protein